MRRSGRAVWRRRIRSLLWALGLSVALVKGVRATRGQRWVQTIRFCVEAQGRLLIGKPVSTPARWMVDRRWTVGASIIFDPGISGDASRTLLPVKILSLHMQSRTGLTVRPALYPHCTASMDVCWLLLLRCQSNPVSNPIVLGAHTTLASVPQRSLLEARFCSPNYTCNVRLSGPAPGTAPPWNPPCFLHISPSASGFLAAKVPLPWPLGLWVALTGKHDAIGTNPAGKWTHHTACWWVRGQPRHGFRNALRIRKRLDRREFGTSGIRATVRLGVIVLFFEGIFLVRSSYY